MNNDEGKTRIWGGNPPPLLNLLVSLFHGFPSQNYRKKVSQDFNQMQFEMALGGCRNRLITGKLLVPTFKNIINVYFPGNWKASL